MKDTEGHNINKIERMNYMVNRYAGDYFTKYRDLPSDTVVGREKASVRDVIEKLNEVIGVVNNLIDKTTDKVKG